ncbi:hypothetical protein D3C78_1963500 [compost metagenome]
MELPVARLMAERRPLKARFLLKQHDVLVVENNKALIGLEPPQHRFSWKFLDLVPQRGQSIDRL